MQHDTWHVITIVLALLTLSGCALEPGVYDRGGPSHYPGGHRDPARSHAPTPGNAGSGFPIARPGSSHLRGLAASFDIASRPARYWSAGDNKGPVQVVAISCIHSCKRRALAARFLPMQRRLHQHKNIA